MLSISATVEFCTHTHHTLVGQLSAHCGLGVPYTSVRTPMSATVDFLFYTHLSRYCQFSRRSGPTLARRLLKRLPVSRPAWKYTSTSVR
jgi:hypothetical protein